MSGAARRPSTGLSLVVRLEKLKFIVSELQLAFHLARHAPDDFAARTLARHVAVRAENFIAHARALRKPLKQVGFDTKGFHDAKELYAKYFDEYFHVVRDKLGAHMQDLDFAKRIELWNDIESVKIGFFVDEAKEIYDRLVPLGIPGYTPYVTPPELMNTALTAILEAFKQSGVTHLGAEMGVDPLALTRPNAGAILNMTPVHARAGQLVLLRRWIKIQKDGIARVAGYDNLSRILKSRIITDVVSFFDGLITRSVAPGAPQEMDGLDTLVVKAGQNATVIDEFLKVFAFEPRVEAARRLRDRIGAHLEINDAIPLSIRLAEIDGFDLTACLAFYDRLTSVFEKVCRDVVFLRMYVADGHRLYGVMPNLSSVRSFDERNPSPPVPTKPVAVDYNCDQGYHENLAAWISGDETSRQDARQFFWHAFLSSEVVEQFTEVEHLGAGATRSTSHDLRRAHHFILGTLRSSNSGDAVAKILDLLVACRNGDPHKLTEILLRYSRTAAPQLDFAISYCLGEISGWPQQRVSAYLESRAAQQRDWELKFLAVLALFKIYARSEGITRINRKMTIRSYANDIAPMLEGITAPQRLLCTITFASQFCSPAIATFGTVLAAEYDALRASIEALCNGEPFAPACAPVADTLRQLLRSHDYAGLCLLLSDQFRASGMGAVAESLLTAVCRGWVTAGPNQHQHATRHLAACYSRNGDHVTALDIAEKLAAFNPDDVLFQILVTQILAATPGACHKARQRVTTVKAHYKIPAEHEPLLKMVEQYLAELPP